MEIIGKKHLEKLKRKNKGNAMLCNAIDKLLNDLEKNNWSNKIEVFKDRPDADCVYETFYFFNIYVQRAFVLIEFQDDEVTVMWCGNHTEYEKTFRNNKDTIRKWLKDKEYIE